MPFIGVWLTLHLVVSLQEFPEGNLDLLVPGAVDHGLEHRCYIGVD